MSEHTMLHLISFEHKRDHSSDFGSEPMEHRDIAAQLDLLHDRVLLLGGKTEEAVN